MPKLTQFVNQNKQDQEPLFKPEDAVNIIRKILADGYATVTWDYKTQYFKMEATFYLPNDHMRQYILNLSNNNPDISYASLALAMYLRGFTLTFQDQEPITLQDFERDLEGTPTLLPKDNKALEERVNKLAALPTAFFDKLTEMLQRTILLDRFVAGDVDVYGQPITNKNPFRLI